MCILPVVSQACFLHLPTPVTASVKKGQGGRKENHNKHKHNHHYPQKQKTQQQTKQKQTKPQTLPQNASIVHEKSGLCNDAEAVGLSATSPTGRELLAI